MRGVVFSGPGIVDLANVAEPELGPDDVIVDVSVAGICGSDLLFLRGDREAPEVVAGHEYVGRVRTVGSSVTGLTVGDRVVPGAVVGCGRSTCETCADGRANLCGDRRFGPFGAPGGFAQRALVPRRALHTVPVGVSDHQAALAEPLSVGLHALLGRRGDDIAVIGTGAIGLGLLHVARAKGLPLPSVVGRYEHQRSYVEQHALGSAVTTRELVAATPGCIIVAAPGASAIDLAVEAIAPGGTVILLAGYSDTVAVDLRRVVSKEIAIVGRICVPAGDPDLGRSDAIDEVLAMIVDGRLDPTALVTHTFPLAQAASAFAVANDKRSKAIKVHLVPEAA